MKDYQVVALQTLQNVVASKEKIHYVDAQYLLDVIKDLDSKLERIKNIVEENTMSSKVKLTRIQDII